MTACVTSEASVTDKLLERARINRHRCMCLYSVNVHRTGPQNGTLHLLKGYDSRANSTCLGGEQTAPTHRGFTG